MFDPLAIMTVRDVAAYLQASEYAVIELIESGTLSSFTVAGEPRVQAGALISWFQSEMHVQELKALKRTLENKKIWSTALKEEPNLREQIEDTEYKEGTFGAFLKSALTEHSDEPSFSNLKPKKDRVAAPIQHTYAVASRAFSTDYIGRLKSRPAIAFLVAVTVTVIGVGAFTDALTKISVFLVSFIGHF